MSTFEDPNRESVGLDPIWTGAGEEPEVPPEGEETYDPGEHTVAEVEEYLASHPDERDAVLELERSGKNRTTLVGEEPDSS